MSLFTASRLNEKDIQFLGQSLNAVIGLKDAKDQTHTSPKTNRPSQPDG